MVDMDERRWAYTREYLRRTFGAEAPYLTRLREEAAQTDMPDIAVSADVGRFLELLTSMTQGRLAIEVGTLAGYSALWLARGLRSDGKLLTIERDDTYAAFAEDQFERAGFADRISVRRGAGLDVLRILAEELDPGSVDVVFLDAEKNEYPNYFRLARPLIASGGLLIADNALGSSQWWIDQEGHPDREGAHALNEMVAADDKFTAVALPIREGVLVARRR